jgi:colanic acid/amylovoran biosynthesis glycosyltransferase
MPVVLHLLNSYLPATETFIWQYLSHAREFQALILADRMENIERFPLPRAGFVAARPSKGRLASIAARLRGRYAEVDYRACLEEVRLRKPSLVHVHNGYRACVSLGFTETLHLPKAVNFYGSDLTQGEFLRRARHGYGRLFKTAAAFLVEGPAMRLKLAALGCPEDRIHLQRIAVDPYDYLFKERTWDGKRTIRFLFVGRLVEKKGLEYGLRALAECGEAFPWELTVVGDGPLRASLEALAARLGMASRMRVTGYLPLPAIRDLMASHDLQLQPSCTAADGDGEGGAPTAVLEAMACGLPVVSTLHDDIPYVTSPGGNALLAPERDAGALAAAIREMVGAHASWPAMSRLGRSRVERNHDVKKEIGGLEKIYRTISA